MESGFIDIQPGRSQKVLPLAGEALSKDNFIETTSRLYSSSFHTA